MRTTARKQGRRVEAVADAIILSRPLQGENNA